MNAYSEAFYQYVREHPLKMNDVQIESVLELFYECYAEGVLRDTPKMKDCIRIMYELTSPRTGDALMNVVSDFVLEAERRAFLEGIRVGARWGLEIIETRDFYLRKKEDDGIITNCAGKNKR